MTERIPRCVLTLLCVAVFSMTEALPARAQQATGQEEAPASTAVSGFESIDGTRLRPTVLSYDASMKISGGQPVDLSSTLTITAASEAGTDTWTLVNEIEMPRGTKTDSLIVDRSSLLPMSRHQRGGPIMDLTYTGSPTSDSIDVSGTVQTRGNDQPIRAELEGPTLASGVHDVIALAAMPLGPNFRTALRVFFPQDQTTKQAVFETVGTETVETPAGSFETYVVDLNVGNGQVTGTVHLRKEAPHYYVKWKTEVASSRGTRIVTQTLSSMETQALPTAQ